jgi:hypothetical protein
VSLRCRRRLMNTMHTSVVSTVCFFHRLLSNRLHHVSRPRSLRDAEIYDCVAAAASLVSRVDGPEVLLRLPRTASGESIQRARDGARMPNLNLGKDDISALVAFINREDQP